MPKMPNVRQYGGPTKEINTNLPESSSHVLNNIPVDIVAPVENSTAQAQLYVAKPITQIIKDKNIYYLGTHEYQIVNKNTQPIDIHSDYIQTIINSTMGYIKHRGFNKYNTLVKNYYVVLAHIFCAILNYNNILFYPKIKIHTTNSEICLGEVLVYNINHSLEQLNIYINRTILNSMFRKKEYSITFNDELKKTTQNRQYFNVLKDSEPHEELHIRINDIQTDILRLHVLADHAATHFLEEHVLNRTDFIQHLRFGLDLPGYTTTHIAFRMTANIQQETNKVKILTGTTTSKEPGEMLQDLFSLQLSGLQSIPQIPKPSNVY